TTATGIESVPTLSPSQALDLSIILPCLNEARTVGACVRQGLAGLESGSLCGEVLVVDNGSDDGSAEIAEAAGARVVREPERGKGKAFRRGVSEARGAVILMADADGTYDLTNLAPFVDPLRNGADMVIGNRLKGTIHSGAVPLLHRYFGNPFFSLLISI